MKTLNITPTETGFNRNHRKENNFMESFELLTVDNGKIKHLATLRIYGTKAQNYAAIWIHDSKTNIWTSGTGSAGGYGYHRPSAAAAEAIKSAGVKLSHSISGRGDRATEEALLSIGKFLRPRSKSLQVLKAHA